MFVVRSLAIDYARPASFNDELDRHRGTHGAEGAVQIVLAQRVARGDEELARASVRIACVNTASFRPVRIPGGVAAALNTAPPENQRTVDESHRNP